MTTRQRWISALYLAVIVGNALPAILSSAMFLRVTDTVAAITFAFLYGDYRRRLSPARGADEPGTDLAASWLAQETTELLEAGPVGLYELRWLLKGLPLVQSQAAEVAREVVQRLVLGNHAELFTMTWPDPEPSHGPHDLSILDLEPTWLDEPAPRYLALVPVAEPDRLTTTDRAG